MTLTQLRQRRADLIAQARAIHGRATAETRSLNDTETAEFDKLMAAADEVRGQVERLERLDDAERDLASRPGRRTEPTPAGGAERRDLPPHGTPEYRSAYAAYLRHGPQGLGPEEYRALNAVSGPTGGYLVAPMELRDMLIKAVDNRVFMRQQGTVLPRLERAESIGVPTLAADLSDADWTSELATGSEDSTMNFGRREMRPHEVAKRVKVSDRLLALSAMPVEQLVNERLAYKFGVTLEKGYLTGDGVNKPLGLFTASADGVPTSRDVTATSSSELDAAVLIRALHSLNQSHRANASWLFHRLAIQQIALLVDTTGQYIWRTGLAAGSPDTLLGRPVFESEYAPATFTTGLYVGLVGDLRHYTMVDTSDLVVKRLVELYAESSQVGFIGKLSSDGAPTLAEAFARIKLG